MSDDITNVSEFRTKDDYPQETAEQWDDIRAGEYVLVDESGYPVDDVHDADQLLRPAPIGGAGLPPVGSTPVGEPEDPGRYDLWLNPETKHVMVWADGSARMFADLTEVL